jgi:hypothetical protein
MNYENLQQCFESIGQDFFPDINRFSDFGGNCAFDGKVSLPLEMVSGNFTPGDEILIEDENGQPLGTLCLCRDLELDLSSITDIKYTAYISEIPKDLYRQPYRFQSHHLVIETARHDEYFRRYSSGSMIWGGFTILDNSLRLAQPYRYTPQKILALPDINLPTDYHKESLLRSIAQPYAFERFLKLYHLFELLFDFEIVERIRNLGPDLKGIGQILTSYEKEERKRLETIISIRCVDFNRIEVSLNRIFLKPEYISKIKTIFFDYEKEGNPYKNGETKFQELINRGSFSEQNAIEARVITSRRPPASTSEYQKLLINTCVYWIYRTRCSIAHSKIGEYVMTTDDEEFVALVMEPIIRELLYQSFK